MPFRPFFVALVSVMAACGGSTSRGGAASAATPVEPLRAADHAPIPAAEPEWDAAEVGCATDADCMVGTPRDCCTGFCVGPFRPWSQRGWQAYQAECRATPCTSTEELACDPNGARPAPVAVCVEHHCALR